MAAVTICSDFGAQENKISINLEISSKHWICPPLLVTSSQITGLLVLMDSSPSSTACIKLPEKYPHYLLGVKSQQAHCSGRERGWEERVSSNHPQKLRAKYIDVKAQCQHL